MRRGFVGTVVVGCAMVTFGAGQVCRAADFESLLGLPANAVENKGALVICGGGDLPEQIFDEFVALAGGVNAKIVMIPTAYPFDSLAEAERCYGGWFELDVASVHFIDSSSRDAADDDELIDALHHATGVWLGGGDQGRLADIYVGTKVQKAIQKVVERGGVVGGTSAGASAMSDLMIRYGSSSRAKLDQGLGLLNRAVVDQHFTQRARIRRLRRILEEHPDMIGLGIDEGTALIVRGNHLKVIGESKVIICRGATDQRVEWLDELSPGEEAHLVVVDAQNEQSFRTVALERPVVQSSDEQEEISDAEADDEDV